MGEVEIPIGLGGSCGILTMRVTDSDIPPLIPGGFLKATEAIIDYKKGQVTWQRIDDGVVSELIELPSDHVAQWVACS